ncbi:MAG: metallophosphoesterase family protein [DPANN group archaeon]|nr:metallophosphoesterase family protein [DPANN group archaeon]
MKILAFADHHGSPEDIKVIAKKAKDADIIVCVGDFTIFEHEIEYIMGQMNKLSKKVLLIHGNHEDEETVEFLSQHFKNVEFIHKKTFEIEDYIFVGFGGGGFATRDPEFEVWSNEIKKTIKDKKVVLLTHGPPYGTKVDLLGMGYVGNKSFTKFIKKERPALVICGHLHETFNKRDKIGKTLVINPGPEGEIIEV